MSARGGVIGSVPRETAVRLESLMAMVIAENDRQNLVAASTLDAFGLRHIDDSLQLVPLTGPGVLLDIGSGAGFPGLALACVRTDPVHLVEPRARRAEFLQRAADALELGHVTVHARRIERVAGIAADVITARAVANLSALFEMAQHCAAPGTRWVLPKGRSAQSELEAARQTWQGSFELVPSRTDPDAAIVVARDVRRRPAA